MLVEFCSFLVIFRDIIKSSSAWMVKLEGRCVHGLGWVGFLFLDESQN